VGIFLQLYIHTCMLIRLVLQVCPFLCTQPPSPYEVLTHPALPLLLLLAPCFPPSSQMATLERADQLMEELRGTSLEAARGDLEEVKEFAKAQGFEGDLLWWDVAYWAERLRWGARRGAAGPWGPGAGADVCGGTGAARGQVPVLRLSCMSQTPGWYAVLSCLHLDAFVHMASADHCPVSLLSPVPLTGHPPPSYREAKYDLKDELLRPYFALPNVLQGLFGVAKRLFGVEVVPADGEAPVWHPDVRFFKLLQVGQMWEGGREGGPAGGDARLGTTWQHVDGCAGSAQCAFPQQQGPVMGQALTHSGTVAQNKVPLHPSPVYHQAFSPLLHSHNTLAVGAPKIVSSTTSTARSPHATIPALSPLLPTPHITHPPGDLQDGTPKAAFYLDPYSRPAEKRGGAWMAEVVGRSKLLAPGGKGVRLPVAHMVCNQSPPIGEQPSLMTFRCGVLGGAGCWDSAPWGCKVCSHPCSNHGMPCMPLCVSML
jgi:hypothetical protein